jgi:FG-GAP-like repeat/FG-GAP repeat
VNHDGKLDLVAADFQSNTTRVLLGNGDGTFQPRISLTGGAGPSSVLVLDLDATGHLDVAVSDFNGDGTFGKYYDFLSSSNPSPGPSSIAVGDFNGDGRLDLIVVTHNDSTVAILLSQTP